MGYVDSEKDEHQVQYHVSIIKKLKDDRVCSSQIERSEGLPAGAPPEVPPQAKRQKKNKILDKGEI